MEHWDSSLLSADKEVVLQECCRCSNIQYIFRYADRVEITESVPEELSDLIRYSLVRNPEARISLGELAVGINEEISKLPLDIFP